jgi:hypothetical protein
MGCVDLSPSSALLSTLHPFHISPPPRLRMRKSYLVPLVSASPSSSSLLLVLFLFIVLSLMNSQDYGTTSRVQKFRADRILLARHHCHRGDFGAVCRVQVLVSSRYARALLYVVSYLPLPHGVCCIHRLISVDSPPLRARDGLRFTGSELCWRFVGLSPACRAERICVGRQAGRSEFELPICTGYYKRLISQQCPASIQLL